MTPGALILVVALEDLPVGSTFKRTRQDWPLHVTLLNWFTVASAQHTIAALTQSLMAMEPFTIHVDRDAFFGPNNDVPVSLFTDESELKALHTQILATVQENGGKLAQETVWIGDEYTPHTTHHGDKRARPGDDFIVSRVCVVTVHDDDQCEVTRYIPLLGEDSWQ
ncbi:MAG TPA: 2'-5' RNA ligase family protein [Candidatus Microsaccharimonas sp.]|nr:2'-5' RNA ligase family protein [Candidatus Microsaccharimonas sp.]